MYHNRLFKNYDLCIYTEKAGANKIQPYSYYNKYQPAIFMTIQCLKTILLFTIIPLVSLNAEGQSKDSIPIRRQLKKVVVTAQKQPQNVQDVPISISFINAQGINNRHIQTIGNLSAHFPNLYLSNPGDGRNVVGIRGIATTSYDPAVVIYIDGVIQYNLDTYFDRLLDIKRIEVLRGPQGTLYGRNAMGGVINIITQQPSNRISGFAQAEVGNYGLNRYSLRFSAPLVPGKLFLGISELYEKDNGYFKNEFNHSHFDKKHAILGNYYLKFLPGSNWDFTLNYKYSIGRNHGPFALAGSIKEAKENPFRLNQNSISKMVDNVSNASLSILHKGNRIHLSSQTSFQSNYRIYKNPIDGDFSPLDIVSIVNNYGRDWNKVKVWTEELRLSPSKIKNQKISWMAGLFGFITDNPVKQGTYFGKDAGVYGANPYTTLLTINTGTDKGFSVFSQAKLALAPKLDFTFGLRYDREYRGITGTSKLLMKEQQPIIINPDTTGKGNYDALSPEAILSYQANSNHLFYLSYKRGFRAGGISEVSEDPSDPPLKTFGPEYSNNLELGVKNEFMEKKLRWNLSIFYTRVNDIQVPRLIMPEALTITENQGKLRSFGIESEFSALLGKDFSLYWNGGLTNAKFTRLSKAGDQGNEDLSGNRQLFTPDFTSNLGIQYERELGRSKSFSLLAGAEWLWTGTTYFDLSNTLKQNPYQLFNIHAGIKKGIVGLSLWTKNIFNTHYVDYAYDFGAAHLGAPATFGATLKVDF